MLHVNIERILISNEIHFAAIKVHIILRLFLHLTLFYVYYNENFSMKSIIIFIKNTEGELFNKKILQFTITCPGNVFAECFLQHVAI